MKHISDPKAANVNVPAQTPNGRIFLENSQLNISDGLFTKILFDTVSADFVDGIEDTVNHRILPGVVGYYQFNASILLESVLDGSLYKIHVTRSGTLIAEAEQVNAMSGGGTGGHLSINISDVVHLNAMQYLEVGIWHNDASEIVDVLGEETGSFLSVQRVR